MEFDVTVESPQGSRNQYVMDRATRRIRLSRTLFSATRYPTDHGFIEGTVGRDGDPLDALVLVGEPSYPGCTINCRAVGVFVMIDEGGSHEEMLCVPARDPRYAPVQDIADVPEFDLREISHFFEVYKDLGLGTSRDGTHWDGRQVAHAEIEASRKRATSRRS